MVLSKLSLKMSSPYPVSKIYYIHNCEAKSQVRVKNLSGTSKILLFHTGLTQTQRPEIGDNTYAPPLPPHATPTHVRSALVTNDKRMVVFKTLTNNSHHHLLSRLWQQRITVNLNLMCHQPFHQGQNTQSLR